jgi:hypothetical protein
MRTIPVEAHTDEIYHCFHHPTCSSDVLHASSLLDYFHEGSPMHSFAFQVLGPSLE